MASRKIKDLYIDFQPLIIKLLERSNKKTAPWRTFITDGYRSFNDQRELYAKGRTDPGKIVTHAKPGYSWHNFGLAVDIAFQKDGKLSYSDRLYSTIVPIAKELGLEWGGDWIRYKDRPHFQWRPGISLAEARKGERPIINQGYLGKSKKYWMQVEKDRIDLLGQLSKEKKTFQTLNKKYFGEQQKLIQQQKDCKDKLTTLKKKNSTLLDELIVFKKRQAAWSKKRQALITKNVTMTLDIADYKKRLLKYESRHKTIPSLLLFSLSEIVRILKNKKHD